MPPSKMLRSVLQALALAALTDIISWNLTCDTWSIIEIEHEELFSSFANATGQPSTPIIGPGSPGALTGCAAERSNFYLKQLPRDTFRWLILLVVHYYWHIWLEKLLPSRPRGTIIPVRDGKDVPVETSEDVEERIVQKWIAQGKVRRSSISWANTLGKWILELSFGNLWRCALWIILQRMVYFKPSKWSETFDGILGNIGFEFAGCFLSLAPLASLVGFIIVPAYQRIVFEAGTNLVWTSFVAAALNVFVPWFMSTDFMQDAIKGITEAANNGTLGAINGTVEHEHEL